MPEDARVTYGIAFLWTLAWVASWSAVDLGMSAWILAHELPPSVMTRKNDGGHSRALTVSFMLRLVVFACALSLLLASLLAFFEVRRLGVFFALLTAYVFVYNAVQNPQIFDEYAWLRGAVRWCARRLGPAVAIGLGLTGLALLNVELATAGPHGVPRWATAALLDLALAYYLVCVQTYAVPRRAPLKAPARPSSADEPLNLVLIGVDSLRRDVLESYRASHPDGVLAKLLGDSTWFENTVSPIGRTFPALVSIFAAKNPIEHGVRDALSPAILQGDAILAGSPTWRLRHEHGYQTHVAIDDSKFAYFHGGETFDSNRAPRPGIGTHLLPIVLRNKIFFGLLNNRLGYALFPEIENNAAFFFAYKLGYFTDEARRDLKRLAAGSKPFFAMFHSCGLHWPGSAAHPYYPRDGHPPKDSLAFGYMSGWMRVVDAALRTPDKTRVAYNRRLYELGAAMVIERFVEPLLVDLASSGLLERSMVVFYSDHAEALGTSAPLPVRKVPSHGTSLLWDDDSVEETVLAIRLPKEHRHRLPDARRSDQVGTIDILPTFFDVAGLPPGDVEGRSLIERGTAATRLYISETALWLREAFRDQLATKVWKPSMLYRLEPKTGELYLAPEYARQLVSTKQRAIYRDGHRLTLYPTLYGYRVAVERLQAGREAQLDRRALLDELLARYAGDVAEGLLPELVGLDAASGCLDWIDLRKPAPSPLLRVQRAVELVYRHHQVDHALAELVAVALDRHEDPSLRTNAFEHVLVVLELTGRRDASLHAILKGYELPRLVEYIDPWESARLLRMRRQLLNAMAGVPAAEPAREQGRPPTEGRLGTGMRRLEELVWRGEGKTADAQRLRDFIRGHRNFAPFELRLSLLEAAERLAFELAPADLTLEHLRGLAELTAWHRDRGLVHEPGEALARGLEVALHHGRKDLVLELARDAFAWPLLPLRVSLTQLFPALDTIADERGIEGSARFKLLLANTGDGSELDSVRRRERELFVAIAT